MKNLLVILLFLMVLVSCKDENTCNFYDEIEDKNNVDVKSSEESVLALETVKKFDLLHEKLKEKNGVISTRSFDIGLSKLNLLNVKEDVYLFDLKDFVVDEQQGKTAIRSSAKNAGDMTEVKIFTIEFEKDGKKGFAIASGDERISDGMYAFVPEGSLSDTVFNLGLKVTLDRIADVCKNDLENYYNSMNNAKTYSATGLPSMKVEALTELNWNQIYPYNKYVPKSCADKVGTNYNGKAPTGPTATACAQIIAFLKPPAISNTYSLDQLFDVKFFYQDWSPSFDLTDKVGRFMAAVGGYVNTSYDCGGSGSKISFIRDEFDAWGIKYEYKEDANVDLSKLAYNLNRGFPHLTSGFTKKPREGLAWVWEGIICPIPSYSDFIDETNKIIKITDKSKVQLWCNWGFGGSGNGWYADFERPSWSDKTYLDDNCQIYITGITYTNSFLAQNVYSKRYIY